MERVPTGIPGLDGMIEGGFKRNNTILVVGGCGSGKSTLAMQYLYHGTTIGEPGLYVTFEEETSQVEENMSRHGWDIKGVQDAGKLKIVRVDPQDILHLVKEDYGIIVDTINDIKAKRVVIDSLTTVETMIKDEYEKRQQTLKLIKWLQRSNCTNVMVAEAEQDPTHYSRYGIVEFVVDGVIVLYNLRRGKTRIRALEVLKMRGTKQITNLVPYVIDNGIQLQPHQVLFGDVSEQ